MTIANPRGDPRGPEPRRRAPNFFLRVFVDHNPFYLLSAACMLVGCWLLSHALHLHAGALGKMLVLLLAINVYEILLISLGLFLILKRHHVRDGRVLLGLEVLFIIDITFLNAEFFTAHPALGAWLNLIVLILSAAKVWVILRALGYVHPVRLLAVIVLELAALYGVAGILAHVAFARNGYVPDTVFFWLWCLAGVIPVLAAFMLPSFDVATAAPGVRREFQNLIGRLYVALPFVSMLAHLGMAHWVYRATFYATDLAPLLLGMTVFFVRSSVGVIRTPNLVRLHVVLVAIAVGLAIDFPSQLYMKGLHLSPLRLMLLAAAGSFADGYLLFRRPIYLWTIATGVIAAGLGASLGAITSNGINLLRRLIPRTSMEWGISAIGAAFVFLGLGAIVSLLRRNDSELRIIEESS